jgi:hypothetical protein
MLRVITAFAHAAVMMHARTPQAKVVFATPMQMVTSVVVQAGVTDIISAAAGVATSGGMETINITHLLMMLLRLGFTAVKEIIQEAVSQNIFPAI